MQGAYGAGSDAGYGGWATNSASINSRINVLKSTHWGGSSADRSITSTSTVRSNSVNSPSIISDPPAELDRALEETSALSKESSSFDEIRIPIAITIADLCGWTGLKALPSAEIESSLSIIGTLGHGAMGAVDEVKGPNPDMSTFVRKRVLLPPFRRAQVLKIVKEEAAIIEGLTHPHIVQLLGTYEHAPKSGKSSICIMMYPVGDGDLAQFIEETHELLKTDRWVSSRRHLLRRWYSCLASALAYIHAQGIRHQDIKPSNVIYRGDHIYFTDFSSSGRFDPGNTTSTENPARASARYSAPEVLENWDDKSGLKRHGTGSDIFALGCVFFEMLAVEAGLSPKYLQQGLVQSASKGLLGFGRQSTQLNGGFCYAPVISGADTFVREISKKYPFYSRAYKTIIDPMLKHDRKKRPSAQMVSIRLADNSSFPICFCGKELVPSSKTLVPEPFIFPADEAFASSEDHRQHVGATTENATVTRPFKPVKEVQDQHSNGVIHAGDFMHVVTERRSQAPGELDLSFGDLILIKTLYHDGWALGWKVGVGYTPGSTHLPINMEQEDKSKWFPLNRVRLVK